MTATYGAGIRIRTESYSLATNEAAITSYPQKNDRWELNPSIERAVRYKNKTFYVDELNRSHESNRLIGGFHGLLVSNASRALVLLCGVQ